MLSKVLRTQWTCFLRFCRPFASDGAHIWGTTCKYKAARNLLRPKLHSSSYSPPRTRCTTLGRQCLQRMHIPVTLLKPMVNTHAHLVPKIVLNSPAGQRLACRRQFIRLCKPWQGDVRGRHQQVLPVRHVKKPMLTGCGLCRNPPPNCVNDDQTEVEIGEAPTGCFGVKIRLNIQKPTFSKVKLDLP